MGETRAYTPPQIEVAPISPLVALKDTVIRLSMAKGISEGIPNQLAWTATYLRGDDGLLRRLMVMDTLPRGIGKNRHLEYKAFGETSANSASITTFGRDGNEIDVTTLTWDPQRLFGNEALTAEDIRGQVLDAGAVDQALASLQHSHSISWPRWQLSRKAAQIKHSIGINVSKNTL